MNRMLPVVSLCVALLALAAALVPRDPVVLPPPPAEDRDAPRGAEVEAELRRRVEVLEDHDRALWDRVVQLERRQGAVVTDAGVVAPSVVTEVAQLREEVRSVMTGEVLSSEAGRAALKEVLREAEDDRQRERMVQQQQRRTAAVAEQKEKWKAFVSTAKLTWPQEQALTKYLAAEDAARAALTEKMAQGGSSRDEFRALRDQRRETDQAMNGLLDDTQKEQYQALRREEQGGGRGPGRMGGGELPR